MNTPKSHIKKILQSITCGFKDSIYSCTFHNELQKKELLFRENISSRDYSNPYAIISNSHSIPVMDNEVREFLKGIALNGVILDAGGCLGWHWRNISQMRPDVNVIIVDFVKNNLKNACEVLGDNIGKNIFLVHGDVTDLKFNDCVFNGYWSVQTLQHIPNFEKAIREAYRVLIPKGLFANYSLT